MHSGRATNGRQCLLCPGGSSASRSPTGDRDIGQGVPPTSNRGPTFHVKRCGRDPGCSEARFQRTRWGAGAGPACQSHPGNRPAGTFETAGTIEDIWLIQRTPCDAAEPDTPFEAASTLMQPPMWRVKIRQRSLSLEHRYSADRAVDATEKDLRPRGGPFRIRKKVSDVREVGHVSSLDRGRAL